MKAPPRDLETTTLAATLRQHWAIRAELTYLPLGFGDHPWKASAGPYGEPARERLAAHADDVRTALQHYDLLAQAANRSRDTWCLTHGEPAGSNLLRMAESWQNFVTFLPTAERWRDFH